MDETATDKNLAPDLMACKRRADAAKMLLPTSVLKRCVRIAALYLLVLFAAFSYDVLYFHSKIPDSHKIVLALGNTRHVFYYRKTRQDLSVYVYKLTTPACILTILAFYQITAKILTNTVQNVEERVMAAETLRTGVIFLVHLLLSLGFIAHPATRYIPFAVAIPMYIRFNLEHDTLLRKAVHCILFTLWFFGPLFIRHITSREIFPPLFRDAMKWGDWSAKKIADCEALFNRFNIDFGKVYLRRQGLQSAPGEDTYSYGFGSVTISAQKPMSPDMERFKANFYHEMGHYVYSHHWIRYALNIASCTLLLIYLLKWSKKVPHLTMAAYMCISTQVWFAVELYKMAINVSEQVLGDLADKFLCARAPEYKNIFIYKLLTESGGSLGWSVPGEEGLLVHAIAPTNFTYPPLHPLYAHSSIFRRQMTIQGKPCS